MSKLKNIIIIIFLFVGMNSFAQGGRKGTEAYNWKAKDINGKVHSLNDFKGQYIMLDIWATWCGPCRNEIPYFTKIVKKYKDKNIKFISISIDSNSIKWKSFLKKEAEVGSLQLIDVRAKDSPAVKAFGINGIPRFVIIDPNGKILEWNSLRPSDPALEKMLTKLLK
jgi:thiol-disulfide isomerase/thioredoxin